MVRWLATFGLVTACSSHPTTGTSPPDATGTGSNGTLSSLVFAVIGDTRPSIPDDTNGYPTAIIDKIFTDIVAESPAPQFVVGTGDYMFSLGFDPQPQLDLYMKARSAYAGPFYPAMGNHECNSFTDGNCANGSNTINLTDFETTMLGPIGETLPYYSRTFTAVDGSWTAKLVFVACNAWDATQGTWLAGQLAMPATYTFVVRHEGVADMPGTPCPDSQPPIDANPLTLLIVGHTHEYAHDGSDKEIINGIGGAPLTSGTNYGYTMISRNADGTLTVTTKDYMSGSAIDSFSIQPNGDGA
jgi:Calcineurin-like phosphoesterase